MRKESFNVKREQTFKKLSLLCILDFFGWETSKAIAKDMVVEYKRKKKRVRAGFQDMYRKISFILFFLFHN
jgi:hypothetical protein